MEPFIGQMIMFGGNFAPRGWAFCDGQLLAISQNQALFSILGTIYGGDGRTTFALPDLRGRAAVGEGQGPGLSPRQLGQKSGTETTTLTAANLPSHNHVAALKHAGETNVSGTGTGKLLASDTRGGVALPTVYADGPATGNLAAGAVEVGFTGANQSFNNVQPSLAINYIIALQGTYPSRN